mgnify:CR=1 FL=1
MAKIGLNYGEKLQIADKTYRVITDGLDVPAVLGKLSFRGIEGPDIIFEVDRSQRNPDGSFVQVNTGEIRGIVVGILLSSTKPSFSQSQICLSLKLKT